ncbi:MAG: N-acetylmuramoyl-L-alanine amidase [Planctomycetota bacterium]|jgi:hypothetical protein|nr:N-acetylmuramoyl-L-alanine amidase [Planctomycetota bacterium]
MPELNRRQFVIGAACTAFLAGCGRGLSGAGGMNYQVAQGDSLSTVARRSGLSISQIVEANNLRSRHLDVGQRLYLPGVKSMTPTRVFKPEARPAMTKGQNFQLVKRSQWGAQQLRPNHDPMNGIQRLTLHHTSEIPGMMDRSDRELVAAVQRYHQDHQGWADIGYHYIIGRDGQVYEGRPVKVQGAHVGGTRNHHNVGIAAIGDFHRSLPKGKQLAAIEGFLCDQIDRHSISGKQVFGHRELGNTICPGDSLYGWLEDFRRRV